jgi:fluoride ion exporter CrcB/FEX
LFSFSVTPTNLLLGQYIIIYPIKYPQSISIIVIVFQSFSRKRWFWDAETHDSQSQFFRWFMKWGRLFFFCDGLMRATFTAWGYAMVQVFLQPEPLLVWSTIYIHIYIPLLCRFMLFLRGIFGGFSTAATFLLDTNPIPELDHGCTPVIKHGKRRSTFIDDFN